MREQRGGCGDVVEKFATITKKSMSYFLQLYYFASFCQIQNILSPLEPAGSSTGKNELPEVPKERLLYLAAHCNTFLWCGCKEGQQVLHPHWVLKAAQHSCLCLPWLPPEVLHPTAFLEA